MAAEQERVQEEIGKADLANTLKLAQLTAAAEDQEAKHELAMKKATAQEVLNAELEAENRRYQEQAKADEKELALLQQNAEKNKAAIQQIYNKEEQQTLEHENKLTQIRQQAEEQRNKTILQGEQQLEQGIAQSMAQSIVYGKSFSQEMIKMGGEVVEGMIQHTIMMMMTQDWQRASDARTAAANAYASVSGIPYVGPFLAPEAAAAAFAAVMAFEGGGIVPGTGHSDSVPAMLQPEEMVLPKPLSIGVQKMIAQGLDGQQKGGDVHIHSQYHAHAHAFDSDGVQRVLKDHGDAFTKHITDTIRRHNR